MVNKLPKKRGRSRKIVDPLPEETSSEGKRLREQPKKSPPVEEISETLNFNAPENVESTSTTFSIPKIEHSNVEFTVKITETTQKDIESEFPILVDKSVKEIEAGSIVIETKFRADDSTKVVNYVNGKIIDEDENDKTKVEILNCESEDNTLFLNRVLINEANTSDSGNYVLLLANQYKRIIVDYNINIDSKFEKAWITHPAEYTRFSNFLRLRFGIRCLGKFDVKWFHDGVEITNEHRQTIEKSENDRHFISLNIQKPNSRQNGGIYTCQVTSEHNTIKALFNLELEDKRPTIVNEPIIELEAKNTLSLTVEYKSELKSTVIWKAPNGQVIDDKPFSIATKSGKTQLKLANYKSTQHSGTYLCEISNSSGTFVAELNVKTEDEHTPSNL